MNIFYSITKKVDFFPPWKKCVKKIYDCSVKKENLFDPPAGGELFYFREKNIFLAIFSTAAAFFAYFFWLKKKSKCPSGKRTSIYIIYYSNVKTTWEILIG